MQCMSSRRCGILYGVGLGLCGLGVWVVGSEGRSFGEDVAFMREHTEIVELSGPGGRAKVAVAPAYQGRVMTSTARGDDAEGHGFLKDEVIAADEFPRHITVYGGEDRFWMGPEGGQFSIYFEPGVPFEFEYWQTPPVIDTVPYEVVSRSADEVGFRHDAVIGNYSGTKFSIRIDRAVRLLSTSAAAARLGVETLEGIDLVAYESENRITNTGDAAWTRETGMLSIWILSMLKPTPTTTVVVPFQPGPVDELGPVVNDAYFGKVPADRLKVGDGVLYFKADGKSRGKIGLSPSRAKSAAGSYDPTRNLLTLVQYTLPEGATHYVNSMWEIQDHPFQGDVVNSYNDGPPAPGEPPLGPFYELETSSPAAALKPGESITHVHRTLHLVGPPDRLDPIAQGVLGASLEQITSALE